MSSNARPNYNVYAVPKRITADWYNRIYLQTQFWKWRRKRYLDKIEYMCQMYNCADWATQVHHLSYKHLYCEPDEDLMGLCRSCHARMHFRPANDNGQLELDFEEDNCLLREAADA